MKIWELMSGLQVACESAARAAFHFVGSGQKEDADEAATQAMRKVLNGLSTRMEVVIGEGERDQAPMLYHGELLGMAAGEPPWCLAVDPLEGTSLVAKGLAGAMAILAVTEPSGLIKAPDFYMDKLAAAPSLKGKISLNFSMKKNLEIIASTYQIPMKDVVILVQERERHRELISHIRSLGARVKLFAEGDVGAALACALDTGMAHAFMGIGGAPEGVVTAAACAVLGAHFEGKFIYDPEVVKTGLIGNSAALNRKRLVDMGISDPDRVYLGTELASGNNILVVATGVTSGDVLQGVRFKEGAEITETLVLLKLESSQPTLDQIPKIQWIRSEHQTC
jgi:fructose-1,6-bisphosphatase II / sedoheptulose-1,7-bisphosphatase